MSNRQPIDPADIITTAEAAKLAGVKPSTYTKYVSIGLAPASLHPGSGLHDRRAVAAWIESRPGSGRWSKQR